MIDRMRDRWVVAGMSYAAFVLSYGMIGHFPLREPTVLEPTAIDRRLGVHPDSIWMYWSQFALIAVAITACPKRARLIDAGRAALIACVISFAVFLIHPTTVVRPAVISTEPARSGYLLLYGVDPATNCFPSLHASLAGIAVYALATTRWRYVIFGWYVLILASTMTTSQHRFPDVIAGVAVAGSSLAAMQRWTGRIAAKDSRIAERPDTY